MSYDNTSTFVLFKNKRRDSDRHPHYTGFLTDENGKEWEIAAWLKDGKKGKFMSGKISEKRKQERQEAPAQQAPAPDFDNFDDGIPW